MPLSVHVWDFMDRDYVSIRPDAALGEAMETLYQARTASGAERQSMVVLDKKQRPLGVLSMRNILDGFKSEFRTWTTLLGQAGWDEALEKGLKKCNYRLVEDYMVQVPTLRVSDSLVQAYRILTEKNLAVRLIPVVEAEQIAGVVRIPDLFRVFVDAYRKMNR